MHPNMTRPVTDSLQVPGSILRAAARGRETSESTARPSLRGLAPNGSAKGTLRPGPPQGCGREEIDPLPTSRVDSCLWLSSVFFFFRFPVSSEVHKNAGWLMSLPIAGPNSVITCRVVTESFFLGGSPFFGFHIHL